MSLSILHKIIISWGILLFCLGSNAKNLHFIYIDHNESTPVEYLKEKIQTIRTNNTASGDALIVYLSNGSSPLIYCQNINGITPELSEPEACFAIITEILESNSHSVNPLVDNKTILDLLTQSKFAVDTNNIGYDNVTMEFYVGSELWNLGYNKTLIARLYFALEISEMDQNKVKFNIFRPKEMKKVYEEGGAFGVMNVENLNSKIIRQHN